MMWPGTMKFDASAVGEVPLVSIGMPVFNGQSHIDEALRSALAQDYPNLEIIISDNASTDATAEICVKHAAVDSRIRYDRNPENVGATRNFHLTLAASKGKYFTWLAHDDVLHRTDYVSRMVAFMEQAPDVVLCGSALDHLDYWEPGSITPEHYPEIAPNRTWREARLEFFRWPQPQSYYVVYGVYRRDDLARVPVPRRLVRGRSVALVAEYDLLLPLIRYGRIVALPEPLRAYRHRVRSMGAIAQSELTNWEKFLYGLSVKRSILATAWKLDVPFSEKRELVCLALRNFFVANWRRPHDQSVTLAANRKEMANLYRICDERQKVIDILQKACDERLELIERLNAACTEKEQALNNLRGEIASLREGSASTSGHLG
jgi:glycosyltransferase involved in cell wall biosynthesis